MSYNALRVGRYSHPRHEYLVTFVAHDRKPVFAEFRAARIFVSCLRDTANEHSVDWLAWVLMPDHFHGLLSIGTEANLAPLIRMLKGRSALKINKSFGWHGALWQPGFHDHALRAEEDRAAIARYIIDNPCRAGLVDDRFAYPHWDCVWL